MAAVNRGIGGEAMNTLTGRCLVAVLSILATASVPTAAAFAAQEKVASPPPVRVGGDIKPPVKIKDSKPVYPPEARRAKVQGVVIIDVTVGTDGKVTATKVLRSIPMLEDAAIKAVKAREYKPTIVNGVAVAVIMTVPVIFTLQ
jgi:protein TonB